MSVACCCEGHKVTRNTQTQLEKLELHSLGSQIYFSQINKNQKSAKLVAFGEKSLDHVQQIRCQTIRVIKKNCQGKYCEQSHHRQHVYFLYPDRHGKTVRTNSSLKSIMRAFKNSGCSMPSISAQYATRIMRKAKLYGCIIHLHYELHYELYDVIYTSLY